MSPFWIIAAILLLLAMWLVAGHLLRKTASAGAGDGASLTNIDVLKAQLQQLDRDLAAGSLDAAQHQRSRAEIERRALEEESVASAPVSGGSPRTTLVLVLLAVPVLAVALYSAIGTPQALSPEARVAVAPHGGDVTQQDMEAMIAKLAERMAKQPPGQVSDTEGWVMLGRSYAAMQRYPEAQRAFARALQLMPNEAQILADQADVLAMIQGRSLEGEPLKLINQALHQVTLDGTSARVFAGAAYRSGGKTGTAQDVRIRQNEK